VSVIHNGKARRDRPSGLSLLAFLARTRDLPRR
jgi:hypothetical protein